MAMETANYAIVEDGIVTNIIVWDGNTDIETGGWAAPVGAVVLPIQPPIDVGWIASQKSDGTWNFTPPHQ